MSTSSLKKALLFFLVFVPIQLKAEGFEWLAFGDLRGYIETCGCDPRTDLGGLDRLAAYVKRERAKSAKITVFGLGNDFLTNENEHAKQELISKALNSISLDAILFNKSEFRLEQKLLGKRPYVLSNAALEQSKNFPTSSFVIKNNTIILGYFWHDSFRKHIEPWSEKLEKKFRSLLKAHMEKNKVLLFRGSDSELSLISKLNLFQVIISANTNDEKAIPGVFEKENPDSLLRVVAEKSYWMVPLGGLGVLRGGSHAANANENNEILDELFSANEKIDFKKPKILRESSSKISINKNDLGDLLLKTPVIWLDKSFDNIETGVTAHLKTYQDFKNSNFRQQASLREGDLKDSLFAGADSCKSCHPQAYKAWKESKHYHAFGTLKKVRKHEDETCVSCHVLGLNSRGGFVSEKISPGFAGVQCENCHGESKNHVLKPGESKPLAKNRSACSSCHVGSHSPSFDMKTYWDKIKH